MSYAFFPGCALGSTALPYGMSIREVARVLDLEIPELEGWNCCGSSVFQTLDEVSYLSLSGRNLALAERSGSQDLVTPCSGCFESLRKASDHLSQQTDLRQKVDAALGEADLSYQGNVRVRHLLDVMVNDVGLDTIRANVSQPLTGLKVACYYGCFLVRPPGITAEDHPEYPMSMDRLMSALGAQTLDWSYKTQCCGASFAVVKPDLAAHLSGKILDNAREVGAQVVVAACPLCQVNLDTHQGDHAAGNRQQDPIPVLYFTELMGVAFGIRSKLLGLTKHFRNPEPLLHHQGLLAADPKATR